jgi:hypothetical protein
MDVLVSGPKAPTITCSYRIADIANCLVKDETASSREFYVVGWKINDNLALVAAASAFLVTILALGAMAYAVGSTIIDLVRRTLARSRLENLEDSLSLFGKNIPEEIVKARLNDRKSFRYSFYLTDEVKSFVGDENASMKDLLDRARSQSIKASIARDIQRLIADFINRTTEYYVSVPDPKYPTKLVDFEKETINLLVSSRFRVDTNGIMIGLPVLIAILDVAFVCAGPLRTLIQKWF